MSFINTDIASRRLPEYPTPMVSSVLTFVGWTMIAIGVFYAVAQLSGEFRIGFSIAAGCGVSGLLLLAVAAIVTSLYRIEIQVCGSNYRADRE